jgi:hypothetical protein
LLLQQRYLPDGLESLYKHHSVRGIQLGATDNKTLVEIFSESVVSVSPVFVVLDGLDECPEYEAEAVTEIICSLPETLVRVFATSRPHISVTKSFPSVCKLTIRASDTDIKNYLTFRLNESKLFRMSDELQHLIVEKLSSLAGGM